MSLRVPGHYSGADLVVDLVALAPPMVPLSVNMLTTPWIIKGQASEAFRPVGITLSFSLPLAYSSTRLLTTRILYLTSTPILNSRLP